MKGAFMFSKIFPNQVDFFQMFNKQADCLLEGAAAFRKALDTGKIDHAYLKKIQEIETTADDAAGAVMGQLNKSFITPFDREDMHDLTKALDDVIDMMNTISNRIAVYRITSVPKEMIEFSVTIENAVRHLSAAVKGMKTMKNYDAVMQACVEVSRLENVSDGIRDKALGALFDNEKDPITLIKWKELYEDAETVVDICEDAAHVIESIMFKQA